MKLLASAAIPIHRVAVRRLGEGALAYVAACVAFFHPLASRAPSPVAARVARVHVEAEGAAVHLRRPRLDEFDQAFFEPAGLDIGLDREHRLAGAGRSSRSRGAAGLARMAPDADAPFRLAAPQQKRREKGAERAPLRSSGRTRPRPALCAQPNGTKALARR